MQGKAIDLPAPGASLGDVAPAPRAAVRRVVQGVGGGVCVGLAAAMPWMTLTSEGIAIGSLRLPAPLLAGLLILLAAGLGLLARSMWQLLRRLPGRVQLGLCGLAGAGALSFAGIEYGYLRPGTLSAYEYRGAVRMLGYMIGIVLLACSVPEDVGYRFAGAVRRFLLSTKRVLFLGALVVVAGSFIGAVILDGMPHIVDATAYLLQGRMLWSGQLALDTPAHLDLFQGELLAFRVSDAGYYGKYPIGWPLILGFFDLAGAAWLAAPLLAGLLVVLTYLVVAERGSRRTAALSAAVVACCPWLWMNAGTMMSHLASAVWLWLFLWLMVRALRLRSRLCAALSGLVLGLAVLTRPADAAFFALPCVVLSLVLMARRPGVWLTRLPLVVLATLPGLAVYLYVNAWLTGDSGGSSYGDSHSAMLKDQMPQSVTHAIIWLQESWAGLSTQWLAGAAPAGLAIVCGVVFGRRFLKGQSLVLACSLSLFVCYAVFVFGGRAWVGPRWYVPLIPSGAVLIASGLQAAAFAARARSVAAVLGAGYLRVVLVAIGVMLCVVLPVRFVELAQSPPHGIDGRVTALVASQGLSSAVVALPENGLDPTTGQPNYKRGIAGMWTMQTPFEDSDVIYVAGVEGWQSMARDAWPGRAQYYMTDRAGDWQLYPARP